MTFQFTEIPLTLFSNTEVLPNFIALCSFLGGNMDLCELYLGKYLRNGACMTNVSMRLYMNVQSTS